MLKPFLSFISDVTLFRFFFNASKSTILLSNLGVFSTTTVEFAFLNSGDTTKSASIVFTAKETKVEVHLYL